MGESALPSLKVALEKILSLSLCETMYASYGGKIFVCQFDKIRDYT